MTSSDAGPRLASTLRERVAGLDATLSPDDPRFRAGLLLLALAEHPPRIDHLAGLLAMPREFVARCIRRLVDNGVLQNGSLVARWSGGATDPESFWADVKVALGSWLRRQDDRGKVEWIEAGGWHKPFEYVLDRADDRCRTSYIALEGSRPVLNVNGLASNPTPAGPNWIGVVMPGLFVAPVGIAAAVGDGSSAWLGEAVQRTREAEPLAGYAAAAEPPVVWLS